MTETQQPTPSDTHEPKHPASPAGPAARRRPPWGGAPSGATAFWGGPSRPHRPSRLGPAGPASVTPPPAPPAGWSQPGAAAPSWAMTAAPPAQPQGSLMVTLAGVVLLIIGILVGLAGVGLMAVGLVARAAFETAVQNADPVDFSVDAVRVFEGIFVVFGLIVAVYGLGELIAGIGVLLKRQWGRLLGVLLAFIAGSLTTLAGRGASGASNGTRPASWYSSSLPWPTGSWSSPWRAEGRRSAAADPATRMRPWLTGP